VIPDSLKEVQMTDLLDDPNVSVSNPEVFGHASSNLNHVEVDCRHWLDTDTDLSDVPHWFHCTEGDRDV
jgi:hypothetical protein